MYEKIQMIKVGIDMRKIAFLLILSFVFASKCMANVLPSNIPSNLGPGVDNAHDMQILRMEQFEKRKQEDLRILREKKEKQTEQTDTSEVIEDIKEAGEEVIKAKVEEYETKGIYIEEIKITESEILSEQEIADIIDPLIGKNVFFEDVMNAVGKINNLYADKGFVTARAFFPPQTIEGGVIQIELVEGKIGKIAINGNRWTKKSYIKTRISAKPDEVFDIAEFEQDILKFNRYNDGVSLKANLFAGEEAGKTNIDIEVEEKFPFHLTGLFDNAGRNTIGILRGGAMLSADSLFGYRDRATIGMYGSEASITPYADYNIPVNKYDGRLGFMFSSSNSSIINGPYEMFNIKSRSYNYSAYYTHPLIRKPYFELNGYIAGNYKRATTSFDGFDLYTDEITSAQASLNARYDSKRGIWYGFQDFYHAFPIIQKQSRYFKYSGGLTRLHDFSHGIVLQLRGNYQYVPKDVIPYIDQMQAGGIASVRGYSEGLLVGKSGYFISAELMFPIAPSTIKIKRKPPKNERWELQPVEYIVLNEDGENSKKAKVARTTATIPFVGKYVKGVMFLDHAGIFPFKGKGPGQQGVNSNDFLASIGTGLRIQLPGDFTARLYWGLPMINNMHEQYTNRAKWGRFHFELSLAPDFDKLLKNRKRQPNL